MLASALTLRAADLLAVLLLALVAVPELVLAGRWLWAAAAALVGALVVGLCWMRRLRNRVDRPVVRVPPVRVALAAFGAWALEAAVVWEVARAAGQALSPVEAVAVTAATIAAQTVAVTPGGLGSYEAAATAALAATGVPAGAGFAIALTTHAVKTAYSLAVGPWPCAGRSQGTGVGCGFPSACRPGPRPGRWPRTRPWWRSSPRTTRRRSSARWYAACPSGCAGAGW